MGIKLTSDFMVIEILMTTLDLDLNISKVVYNLIHKWNMLYTQMTTLDLTNNIHLLKTSLKLKFSRISNPQYLHFSWYEFIMP